MGEHSAREPNETVPAASADESRQHSSASGVAGRLPGITLHIARIAVGPLVLIGFFLPWAEGSGVLAASEFTGFRLLSFAGRLEQLDLSLLQSGGLWLARILLLGVVVAAVWNAVLAPAHRWHRFYALSGWYLVIVLACALALGAARSGLVLPRLGLALCSIGALLFALSEIAEVVGRRTYPRW